MPVGNDAIARAPGLDIADILLILVLVVDLGGLRRRAILPRMLCNSSYVEGVRCVRALSTYTAGTRHHNETLMRCFGAFLLGIPFQRGSREVHGWVRAIRVDVIVPCVFAHVEDSLTKEGRMRIRSMTWIISVHSPSLPSVTGLLL